MAAGISIFSLVLPSVPQGNIATPFYYLKSEGFWHLVPQPGKRLDRVLDTQKQINETLLGAKVDDELYQYMCAPRYREQLRAVLIENHFAPELWSSLSAQSADHPPTKTSA